MVEFRHGHARQPGRPVYLRSGLQKNRQRFWRDWPKTSEWRMEPLCDGGGRYSRLHRQWHDPSVVSRRHRVTVGKSDGYHRRFSERLRARSARKRRRQGVLATSWRSDPKNQRSSALDEKRITMVQAVLRPDVYFDQIDPDENGRGTVWYRSGNGTNNWKSIHIEGINTYPHRLNPLTLSPDGRFYGTGDDYVGTFLFDTKTDKTTDCGPRVGLAPYTTINHEGKLYLSGYSGGHLFVFDPARPFTLGKGGPPADPAPAEHSARSNPRNLGDFDRTTRVGLMRSSALGADGKIYFGGFGLRHYTGGGFGWFDSKPANSTDSGSLSAVTPFNGLQPFPIRVSSLFPRSAHRTN